MVSNVLKKDGKPRNGWYGQLTSLQDIEKMPEGPARDEAMGTWKMVQEELTYFEYLEKHPNLTADETRYWIAWIIKADLKDRFAEAEENLRQLIELRRADRRTQTDLEAAKQCEYGAGITRWMDRTERKAHLLLIDLLLEQNKLESAKAAASDYAKLHAGHVTVAIAEGKYRAAMEMPATQPGEELSKKTQQIAGQLKANLGSFVLRFDAHKEVIQQQLLFFKGRSMVTDTVLRLATAGAPPTSRGIPSASNFKISQDQAVQAIDILARQGVFDRAGAFSPGPNTNYYSLDIKAGPAVAFNISMGEAEAAGILKALRAIPKGARYTVEATDDSLKGYPIMKGWPIALPGSVRGTPVVADLDGDGDLEVVVPCMYGGYGQMPSLVHPEPNMERLVFAFHHDGKLVEGWPVVVMDLSARMENRQDSPSYSEDWASSPSVMDWDGDKRDELVILNRCGTIVIEHKKDGPIARKVAENGDGWSSVPLVDVNGDGVIDLILGNALTTVNGGGVEGWPKERIFQGGFVPCVGDADGDGELELYQPYYIGHKIPEFANSIAGYDHTGQVLPGWPQQVGRQCLFPPVMGDVNGDGKMEVIAADQRGHILAWTWDGQKFNNTETIEQYTSVFKDRIYASMASPTLADLDGDGVAEIIVYDYGTRSICAWRGDGSGIYNRNGIIARLEGANIAGVTVGDLGGDGVMDLFAGTYWVKLDLDGTTQVINMLPEAKDSSTQCTITDVNGDGKTDVVFGLTDGRVFVYETKLAYKAEWMQWPTANGNFRHTGTWGKSNK